MKEMIFSIFIVGCLAIGFYILSGVKPPTKLWIYEDAWKECVAIYNSENRDHTTPTFEIYAEWMSGCMSMSKGRFQNIKGIFIN